MKIIYTKEDIERHREYGSRGGKIAATKLSDKARKARAQKAAATRWARRKETK